MVAILSPLLKKKLYWAFLVIASLAIWGCGLAPSVQGFSNAAKGYQLLHPNGWGSVEVRGASPGVDVIFRDVIEQNENLSVIINPVPKGKTLADLGSPTDVGYRFMEETKERTGGQREPELITATSLEKNGQQYYLLEYQAHEPGKPDRHSLSSVAISRDKLYTFTVVTNESRWANRAKLFRFITEAFTVN